MNGGFMVIRPNMVHYERMLALIYEGDFRDSTGWHGSGIGWCYGGQTIQGIVPYLYLGEIGQGVADIQLDRCIFNVECFCLNLDYQSLSFCCCCLEHGGDG